MKIVVDNREHQQLPLLREIFNDVTSTQLSLGDYLIIQDNQAVVVERKTITDLIASIRSNRLWDQLLRLMKAEEINDYRIIRRILLIHGSFSEYYNTLFFSPKRGLSTHWAQLMGAFCEILYVYNTPIIYAENDTAFKAFLRILAKREATGKNDKIPEARWYMKPQKATLPVKDRKKYILTSLPYIGERLAENLLTQFTTISNIASASVEELEKVPKIGKKKANLIHQLFNS
ncbi:MAG: helix-hairpin-helix domain-containing protein [Candidatus Bathyarchaeota archaeon]|nr:helix-hairpin-helix domain-containing protein [Candidatus Bathyarchaeota archaeon]